MLHVFRVYFVGFVSVSREVTTGIAPVNAKPILFIARCHVPTLFSDFFLVFRKGLFMGFVPLREGLAIG